MSGNGSILTGVPLTDYQTGPRDTRPDLAIGQAFGRKVTQKEPQKYFVKMDTQSPGFKKARAFYNKTIAERQVSKPTSQTEPLLKQPSQTKPKTLPTDATHTPPKPAEVMATHNLISATPTAPLQIDEAPTDFEQNPFLRGDNLKLKSKKPQKTGHKRRLSFEGAAQKIKSLNQASKALGGKSQIEQNVLIGFDKVANYENQGIPQEYLRKMQEVADGENVLIAVRPVEKICRTLISEGYGSKGLHIKGKSSNWGPMAGFIPVDQKFSKLAGNPEKIAAYNQKNHDSIHVKKSASQEHLHISSNRIKELAGMGMMNNLWDISPAAGYNKAIAFESTPKQGATETFEAHQREDRQWEIFSSTGGQREKLMVIPLTADFDLLFVHSHYEDVDLGQQDKKRPFHPTLGIVSDKTTSVIDALNAKFDRGGPEKNMVHHGADTENPVTEMAANFPTTVLIPKKMLQNLGIYTDSPVLIKNEQELAKLYRTMQASGIKVETNPLWDQLKNVAQEAMEEKINRFGGRRR